jgi:hypothetical protein
MTWTRDELAGEAAALAASSPRSHSDAGQLAAKVSALVKRAWNGGREEHGRELADVLRKLIEDGNLGRGLATTKLLAALQPLIPPPPGTGSSDRSEEDTGLAVDPAPFLNAGRPVTLDVRVAGPAGRSVHDAGRDRRLCPDGGACHHGCTTGCLRVRIASPLSAAGWGDQWPERIREANAESDGYL